MGAAIVDVAALLPFGRDRAAVMCTAEQSGERELMFSVLWFVPPHENFADPMKLIWGNQGRV